MTALAFARRDFIVARSYRFAFAMTGLAALMSLVTFRFISELVGDASALRATGDYFAFVVVGMALAHVLDGSLGAPAAQVRQEQVQGTLEVLASQPVSATTLALGWSTYPVLRGVATGSMTLLLAGPMGLSLSSPNWGAALLALVLAAFAFLALGTLVAAFVIVFQQGAGLTKWMSGAMALAGGVYFPLTIAPEWLRLLGQAVPLTHAVEAMRGALLAGAPVRELAGDLLALGGAAIVLLPVSMMALSAALGRARRTGTLGTY